VHFVGQASKNEINKSEPWSPIEGQFWPLFVEKYAEFIKKSDYFVHTLFCVKMMSIFLPIFVRKNLASTGSVV
jgi:hypothetical protein